MARPRRKNWHVITRPWPCDYCAVKDDMEVEDKLSWRAGDEQCGCMNVYRVFPSHKSAKMKVK